MRPFAFASWQTRKFPLKCGTMRPHSCPGHVTSPCCGVQPGALPRLCVPTPSWPPCGSHDCARRAPLGVAGLQWFVGAPLSLSPPKGYELTPHLPRRPLPTPGLCAIRRYGVQIILRVVLGLFGAYPGSCRGAIRGAFHRLCERLLVGHNLGSCGNHCRGPPHQGGAAHK